MKGNYGGKGPMGDRNRMQLEEDVTCEEVLNSRSVHPKTRINM